MTDAISIDQQRKAFCSCLKSVNIFFSYFFFDYIEFFYKENIVFSVVQFKEEIKSINKNTNRIKYDL